MILHYLKVAFRGITRDRFYTAVNLLGLSVAIACCLLLIFWIRFELSYDKGFTHSERIFKVLVAEKKDGQLVRSEEIRPPVYAAFPNGFPEIEAATFVRHEVLPFSYEDGEGIMLDHVATSEDYLRMFSYEYLEGNQQTAIREKGFVISEETAFRFFGEEPALGKQLTFGFTKPVSAVVRIPENTHMRFDILDMESGDLSGGGVHYVMLREHVRMTPELKDRLSDFLELWDRPASILELQPLRDVHLRSPREVAVSTEWQTYGDYRQIWLLTIAVLLILVIAIINYINTSIAKAMSRMKEVGVRKVTGSTRGQLAVRFLTESFLLSLLSVGIALCFVRFFFPVFSEVMGTYIAFRWEGYVFGISALVCLLITLLSGGYAAFWLSVLHPVYVLRGGSITGSRQGFRKGLIGVQFFLSIAIVLCTFFMYRQLNRMIHVDTGIERENILVFDSNLWYDSDDFIRLITLENPHVVAASMSAFAPYHVTHTTIGTSWMGSPPEAEEMEISVLWCDSHYADVFGLELLQGEFIYPDQAMKWFDPNDETSDAIVINETFRKLMGVDNPVGMNIHLDGGERLIIGVIRDFNFKPLNEEISPLALMYNVKMLDKLFIRTTGYEPEATLDYIVERYREHCMAVVHFKQPVVWYTVESDYQALYKGELRTANILLIFSVLSLILSLLGILCMISFMIEKRSKEIAIRRINGAETPQIVQLFAREFLWVGCVAAVLAGITSWVLMHNWLEHYIYRTSLSIWVFLAVPAGIFLLTLAVITLQVLILGRKRPVTSLRSE